MAGGFVCPPHWKAVRLLYATPRVYADAVTLVDPQRPERRVDVRTLWDAEGAPVPPAEVVKG